MFESRSRRAHNEYDARGACLDGQGLGFQFFTGLDGGLPCLCVPQTNLNCDGTPPVRELA